MSKTKRTATWGIVGGLASLWLLLQNVHAHGIGIVQPITVSQLGYDAGRVAVLLLIAFDIAGILILLFRLSRSVK